MESGENVEELGIKVIAKFKIAIEAILECYTAEQINDIEDTKTLTIIVRESLENHLGDLGGYGITDVTVSGGIINAQSSL